MVIFHSYVSLPEGICMKSSFLGQHRHAYNLSLGVALGCRQSQQWQQWTGQATGGLMVESKTFPIPAP